jgi:hypothetical protein
MLMPRFRGLAFTSALLLVTVSLFAGACQGAAPPPPAESQPDYAPTATIKDLMLSIIDPSADAVWLSVTTVQDEKGITDKAPRNDEEWAAVRNGAIALAEASNLLMMPGRRVARPGEKSETPGVELEPEEMDALIAKDRGAWMMRAKGLHQAALDTLKAVDAKDSQKVFEIGEEIERACENCHSQYWYPNEKIPPVPELTSETPAKPETTAKP